MNVVQQHSQNLKNKRRKSRGKHGFVTSFSLVVAALSIVAVAATASAVVHTTALEAQTQAAQAAKTQLAALSQAANAQPSVAYAAPARAASVQEGAGTLSGSTSGATLGTAAENTANDTSGAQGTTALNFAEGSDASSMTLLEDITYLDSGNSDEFTIIWTNEDGTVLETDTVERDTVPTYDGATPTKAKTAQYTYSFAGWTPAVVPADGDATYTATYDAQVNSYTVTWTNYDDTVLRVDGPLEYGTMPAYSSTPSRPDEAGAQYSFSYWDPEPQEVTGDATYKAVYTTAPIELCVQDKISGSGIANVRFTLTNEAGIAVWISEPTTANGVLSIPRVPAEAVNCGGAVFAPNSSYTLKQIATDDNHVLPQGSYTLKVNAEGTFSLIQVAEAGDLSTSYDATQYGIRYYLYNVATSVITYNYNFPAGESGQPASLTQKLPFLSYDGDYTVTLDDPAIDGYEFVGWAVDNTSTTVKKDGTVQLDTVNVPAHTMTACWRASLHVAAVTYTGGKSDEAEPVEGSEGIFEVAQEKTLTFSSLSKVAATYAEQNPAVKALEDNEGYSFVYATLTKDGEGASGSGSGGSGGSTSGSSSGGSTSSDAQRIDALHYDATLHAWQYKKAGASDWTAVTKGCNITLYYQSTTIMARWVQEQDDGSLTTLDESKLPTRVIPVSADWDAVETLIPAAERSVVEGSCYYRYLALGASDVQNSSALEKTNLQSFSLKNTEEGLRMRTGSSGEGTLIDEDTIYIVYSQTPPENSAYLDIQNNAAYSYALANLFYGTEAMRNDALANGRVVIAGGEVLRVAKATDTVASGNAMSLVLLDATADSFVLNGGFSGSIANGTLVSAGVSTASSVVRTTLEKRSDISNDLANTKEVTQGALVEAPGKVTISFDSQLTDITLKKEWSEDSYPENYEVGMALFEDGIQCSTLEAVAGLYMLKAANDWTTVVKNVPQQCTYSATEQSIKDTASGADITGNYTASVAPIADGVIVTSNTRSNPVCRVGTQEFTTIKAAVDYLADHNMSMATIEMIADYIMAESGSVIIPRGYTITLKTAEDVMSDTETKKTITRGFSGEADTFLVEDGATFNVENVKLTGTLGSSVLAKEGNGALVRVAGGTLTARTGSEFTGGRATNGSAIYVSDGGTVALAGARITGNRAISGGAVGIADNTCIVRLSGATYVYNNRDGNGGGQYNIYLNQNSQDIIKVVEDGLSADAAIGIYVPNGDNNALYNGRGAPAKIFGTFEEGANTNLDKLINDRLSSGSSKYGHESSIEEGVIVWGETFSFTVLVQWLDAELQPGSAPTEADASIQLKLNGGNTTNSPSVQTTVTRTSDTGWSYTFTGLAKYDGNGNPYGYSITEPTVPSDYRRIIFTGDRATQDNVLRYDAATGDNQSALVSNYYRYTTFTVEKTVAPASQSARSSFAVYGILKDDVEYKDNARLGGVGSVSDLPLALRDGVSDAWANAATYSDSDSIALPKTERFFTVFGGNNWYIQLENTTRTGAEIKAGIDANLNGSTVKFHRYYDFKFEEFNVSGASIGTLKNGEEWQAGDVVCINDAGDCSVYGNDSAWHKLSVQAAIPPIEFDRQDGNGGVESIGGRAMNQSCTITGSDSYTFQVDKHHLSADYYYYAVETTIQETNGQGRTISGAHKLVATYDPRYTYDQLHQKISVINTRQDYLSVDKEWPEDATTMGTCVFDVYEITDGNTIDYLSDASNFEHLVTGNAGTKVAEFTLPEQGTNSWVHVLKEENLDPAKVYFVREREAGGITIVNPAVSDKNTAVDAVYSYDKRINQITVHNMSDILCKIDDADGEHPFRTLNDALTYGRTRTTGDSNSEFTIQMLRDYSIPASDVMSLRTSEKITLTTASTETGTYRYKSANNTTKATITRKSGNTLPFTIVIGDVATPDNTSFVLENIAMDGANGSLGGKLSGVTYSNGSIVYARNASVVVRADSVAHEGVEIRNAVANNGGAIYAESSTVTISDALFENCRSTYNANSGQLEGGGGAVWTSSTGTTLVKDSTFKSCSAVRSGGALASVYQHASGEGDDKTIVTNCLFEECSAGQNGGGVYSRNLLFTLGGDDESACTFTNCDAYYRGGGACHDNMKEASLTDASYCTFTGCFTKGGDDGQTNRHGGGGLQSNACEMKLTNSTFVNNTAYVRGGGLLHINVSDSKTTIADCTFESCSSTRSGGGGMGLATLSQTVRNCTFTDCAAPASAGGGYDVVCFDGEKDAVIDSCTFTRCVAGGANGGGICFGGTTLIVSSSTFDACKSSTQHGGAISVSAGGSMEELTLNGCTFTDCTAASNSGGAVFSNSITVNVNDAQDGTHTTFTNCGSKYAGGAISHEKSAAGTQVLIANAVFDGCSTASSNGGAVRTRATVLEITGSEFSNCTSWNNGGAVFQEIYATYIDDSHAQIADTTFKNCSSENQGGAAIYTDALALSVEGPANKTTFDTMKSVGQGGAIYHNRATENSSTTLRNVGFYDCVSSKSSGGSLRTTATKVHVTNASFDTSSSSGEGGALNHTPSGTYGAQSELIVADSTFAHCASETQTGGAIYTTGTLVTITGQEGDTTFTDCKARGNGGAVSQNLNRETAKMELSQCTFKNCATSNGSGGAVYTTATKMSVDDCAFGGNSAADACVARVSGGAIAHNMQTTYLAASESIVTNTTFSHCSTEVNDGGALYDNSLVLKVTGQAGVPTFDTCTAYRYAGAIYHDRSSEGTQTIVTDCTFDTCNALTNSGGALLTWAAMMDVTNSAFSNCTTRSNGGAIYHGPSNSNATIATTGHAFITDCTFDTCTATTGSGGAVYSTSVDLMLQGNNKTSTFNACTSQGDGGALCHNRNSDISKTNVKNAAFADVISNNGRGGCIATWTTTVNLDDVSITDSTAKNSGGALFHQVNNNYWQTASLMATHCSFVDAHSQTGSGGAIWTDACSLMVTGGSGTSVFKDCSTAYDGGALCHNRNGADSKTELVKCEVSGCSATYSTSNNSRGGALYSVARAVTVDSSSFKECLAKHSGGIIAHIPNVSAAFTLDITNSTFDKGTSLAGNGGGVYSARSEVTLTNSSIKNCTALQGGGVYQSNGDNRSVTLDNSTVSNNTAATYGGGIYFYSQGNIVLRNGTSVTNNTLSSTVVDNAAGIFISQNCNKATLVLGKEGAENDTITVYNNKTAAGAQSNVRLITGSWNNKVKRYEDRNDSVLLYSNLLKRGTGAAGSIGVVNPGPENTRFGVATVGGRAGVEYIVSDIDTLHGKLDPADHEQKRIIWYAPPVCKITDQYGWPFYYDNGKPAVFSSLKDAIEVLNVKTAGYIVDGNGMAAENLQLQMLVAEYPLEENLPALNRSITLTTSATGPNEYFYPQNATSERCTITRGAGATTSLFTVASGVQLTVQGITLDGGDSAAKRVVISAHGGLINGKAGAKVVLAENAVLQNSAVGDTYNGGGVYITGGSDTSTPVLTMRRNATIEGCSAGNGGGIYLTGGVLAEMNDSPHIENCAASHAGGAIYVSPYATLWFNDNPNPVITGNYLTDPSGEGAGIYLPSNQSKLLLRLGPTSNISGNYVKGSNDPTRLNGGDHNEVIYQDIYIGETGDPATSITLIGDLSVPAGTIWVWAKSAEHYKAETQFAVVQTDSSGWPTFTPRESSLAALRNAQDDSSTENDTDIYLYGIPDDGVNVIWSFTEGTSQVILRKVAEQDGAYQSLAGAVFSVYKGKSGRAYVVKHADGSRETLSGLTSGENGVFWVGSLPFGTYCLEETTVPSGYDAGHRWFKLTVDENGSVMSAAATSRAVLQ